MDNNNARIAKNTIFLYIRMIVVMLISLFTTRVVLEALGVDDYGIYNLIGGIVILFSIIEGSLRQASQRNFAYEIGRKDSTQLTRIFHMSITVHMVVSLGVLILAETIGLWFVSNKLDIPSDRHNASLWVYQFTVIAFLINLLKVPYTSLVIAKEKMAIFAWLSIFEVVLKLSVAYLLKLFSFDRLIIYSALLAVSAFLLFIIFVFICRIYFKVGSYTFFWDKSLFNRIISFSGYSLLGSTSNIVAQQGGNVLLNLFSGVTVNAAFGLANQVSSAINGFVGNFKVAYNPQIVKYYAEGNIASFFRLSLTASRISYFLLLIVVIPFFVNADYIFTLWLTTVPNYTTPFCMLMILYFLIDAIQGPVWECIYATGKIKTYEIWLSSIIFLNLPISFLFLYIGCSPIILLVVRVGINLITAIVRMFYVKGFINYPVKDYCKQVLFRAVVPSACILPMAFFVKLMFPQTIISLIVETVIIVTISIIIIVFMGFSQDERGAILTKVRSYVKK